MDCVIKKCVNKAIKTGLCSCHYKRRMNGDYSINVTKKYQFGTIEEALDTLAKKAKNGCVEYKGNIKAGYGRITFGSKRILAHRAAYEIKHGPIPMDKEIHHKCGNTLCVNTEHLEAINQYNHIKKLNRDDKGRLIAHSHT